MKVWVLVEYGGEGDETELVGIYSSEQIAADVQGRRNREGDVVEEFDVDASVDWQIGQRYLVILDARTGEERSRGESDREWRHPADVDIMPAVMDADVRYISALSPVSFEDAERVARAEREKFLAIWNGGNA